MAATAVAALRNLIACQIVLLAMLHFCCGTALVPALFVFGDSTVDTGNNNFLKASQTRADHLPYGRDLVPPGPAGRFSNGKLPVDYIAEFLGLPYPIDYYNPDAQGLNLLQGVNFASAGSGYLDSTGASSGSVIFTQQLKNFKLAQQSLVELIGAANIADWMANCIFVISSGGNDIIDYQKSFDERITYTSEEFNSMLTATVANHIKSLYDLGARKIVIISAGPLGCLPVALTVFLSLSGGCINGVNAQARSYNAGLVGALSQLNKQLEGARIVYGNAYDPILAAVQNPEASGFKYGNKACCGDGIYGGFSYCTTSSTLCADASEYVFWDLIHPTQAMYKILSDGIVYGPSPLASPVNLSTLVTL
ncbi:hypothetical protein O6H91_07G026500 [Diphasiastrum complanatum]|uniref:Uncharacterized protein n=1 Tax=Diphasiastrum complanatum TaxID=34168 RepID=A0ACC2D3F3_DIPCM|nr:hypothetical protein O6H91_07G026500 [Diphasiastrum complanatum]